MAGKESSFTRWYANNKHDYNALRRKRYRADKAYRQSALKQAKAYREEHPQRYAPRPRVRTSFSIGEAALSLGVAIQTLRKYENKGYLPVTKKGMQHRRYTPSQVELIRELAVYLKEHNYHELNYRKSVAAIVNRIYKHWEG